MWERKSWKKASIDCRSGSRKTSRTKSSIRSFSEGKETLLRGKSPNGSLMKTEKDFGPSRSKMKNLCEIKQRCLRKCLMLSCLTDQRWWSVRCQQKNSTTKSCERKCGGSWQKMRNENRKCWDERRMNFKKSFTKTHSWFKIVKNLYWRKNKMTRLSFLGWSRKILNLNVKSQSSKDRLESKTFRPLKTSSPCLVETFLLTVLMKSALRSPECDIPKSRRVSKTSPKLLWETWRSQWRTDSS